MLGIVQFYFYFKTSLAVGGIDYKHTRGLQRSGRRPHEGLGDGWGAEQAGERSDGCILKAELSDYSLRSAGWRMEENRKSRRISRGLSREI